MGNALRAGTADDDAICQALSTARDAASPLVREHIDWALTQQAGT
jgi:epoxyqueuosine reductase